MFEACLIIGLIVVYFLLMFFYPEWVGITGKVAKKNEEAHKKGTKADDAKFFKE
ncbi:MAG: hypothetical protein V4596_13170 [Bdellovibrionota bacterium]